MFTFLKKRKEARQRRESAHRERMRKRLAEPDFDAILARFGRPASGALRKLYSDLQEVQRQHVTRIVPDKREDEWIFVCWYEPLDTETLDSQWDHHPHLLQFADDGSGSKWAVDPTEEGAEIHYLEHETGDLRATGVKLGELLALDEAVEGDD